MYKGGSGSNFFDRLFLTSSESCELDVFYLAKNENF